MLLDLTGRPLQVTVVDGGSPLANARARADFSTGLEQLGGSSLDILAHLEAGVALGPRSPAGGISPGSETAGLLDTPPQPAREVRSAAVQAEEQDLPPQFNSPAFRHSGKLTFLFALVGLAGLYGAMESNNEQGGQVAALTFMVSLPITFFFGAVTLAKKCPIVRGNHQLRHFGETPGPGEGQQLTTYNANSERPAPPLIGVNFLRPSIGF